MDTKHKVTRKTVFAMCITQCHGIKDATENVKFKISNPATQSKHQIDVFRGNFNIQVPSKELDQF